MRLPKKISALYGRLMVAIEAAVKKGGTAAGEDDSRGYSLTNYPPARSLELQMRKYVLQHEEELLRVLANSSDPQERRIAAEVLGYATQSPRQIAALVRATHDPDADVRNNATRAVWVLASSGPRIAEEIPAQSFITMLKSGVWSDRNKASLVLMKLTRTRNKALLAELRAQALEPLIEMAKWHDHAAAARIILGRIAGIPERQLMKEAFQSSPGPILNALAKHQ